MTYLTPQELWKMNSSEFNAWRRANDLKNLFKVFESTLPSFDKWLAVYSFTVDFILETDQPGQFFYGEKENCLIKTSVSYGKSTATEKLNNYFIFSCLSNRFENLNLKIK